MRIRKKTEIRTPRLVLHAYRAEDRDALVRLFTDPEVTNTFMVPDYPEKQQFYELADKLIAFSQPDDEKHLEYGIFLDGKPIGFVNDCGYDEREIEIGYVIDPACKGRGYATEAVRALLPTLWELGFEKVSAGYFEGNEGSRRVMEKCGMHATGEWDEEEYRGVTHKCYTCEILRPETEEPQNVGAAGSDPS